VTSTHSRRSFLGRGAAAGLGIAFAGSIDAIAGTAANAATRSAVGYGALVPDPAGILSLPEGFSYRILATAGQTVMEDGSLTPADMDGMAVFARGSGTALICNHEISGSEAPPVLPVAGLTYDVKARGGTTTIDLDAADTDYYDGPDSITVSPYGGVILAEDGEGVQHLVGVTEQGKSYVMARNDQGDSEFTGPVFSPDGRTLFACIQSGPGRVFAITGPWGRPSNAPR
jgi:secreted PhoX family phosphatase